MEFDLILWGATGYTGQLVAAYLAANAPRDLRWAIAGRNQAKLARVQRQLGDEVELVLADSQDPASIRALVDRTKLVISTVGPYARHGTSLVAACAAMGRDYVDLTGEPQWVRRNIVAFDAIAKASGARIVHSCGFDCVPADLGVYLLRQTLGAPMRQAHMRVRHMRGGLSGGTLASMLLVMDEHSHDPHAAAWFENANALLPDADAIPLPPRRACYDHTLATWTAPFLMDLIDVPVIHRSNALLGGHYGGDKDAPFTYDEAMVVGGRAKAEVITAGMRLLLAGGKHATSRAALRRLATSPGDGPSAASRSAGSFELEIYGTAVDGRTASVTVAGDRDPGYGETSVMIAEAALCLRLDLPTSTASSAGILTPAATMAKPLITRLRRAGMRFTATTSAS